MQTIVCRKSGPEGKAAMAAAIGAPIPEYMAKAIEVIKQQKALWVEATGHEKNDPGIMCGMVLMHRGGQPKCMIYTPASHRMMTLQAANIARRGFCADELTTVAEGACPRMTSEKDIDKSTVSSLKHIAAGKDSFSDQDFYKKNPDFTPCLNVTHIDLSGKVTTVCLSYDFDPEAGVELTWNPASSTVMVEDRNDPNSVFSFGGPVMDLLRKIMTETTAFEDKNLLKSVEVDPNDPAQREEMLQALEITGRKFLRREGFQVLEVMEVAADATEAAVSERAKELSERLGAELATLAAVDVEKSEPAAV